MIAFAAMQFAMEAHKDQKRKYTGNPYSDHLAEVAGLVATVDNRDETIAAAWLHDSIEDQNVTVEEIEDRFGIRVAQYVYLLTDCEKGDRAERKRLSRERLAGAPEGVQNIKVADIISNISSIQHHDPEFADLYLEEKRLQLNVLTKAHAGLIAIARSFIGVAVDCYCPRCGNMAKVVVRDGNKYFSCDVCAKELAGG